MRLTRRHLLGGLLIVLLLLALASLGLGPVPISPARALAGLWGTGDREAVLILREVRLPRLLLALAIGAGLGAAGAALQALLRNPLADPGLTGVSATAALGAVLVFYLGAGSGYALALPLGGLAGALLGTLCLLGLAHRGASSFSLILAGVALGSLASAASSLVLSLVDNPYAAYEIVFWLMGSLADRSLTHAALAVPFTLAGVALLWRAAPALDTLALGEDIAASLGTDLPRLRTLVVAGAALAVGPGVAVAGLIGFVGLLVPHALRPLVGHRPSVLVPLSALGGAALTLLADLVCRLLPAGGDPKLGVITALVGAPFLLVLLWRVRDSGL